MTDAAAQEESRKVTDWLLAILRFAVTRNTNDRAAVQIMAGEMDRLGSHAGESTFAYFFRTSCNSATRSRATNPPKRLMRFGATSKRSKTFDCGGRCKPFSNSSTLKGVQADRDATRRDFLGVIGGLVAMPCPTKANS